WSANYGRLSVRPRTARAACIRPIGADSAACYSADQSRGPGSREKVESYDFHLRKSDPENGIPSGFLAWTALRPSVWDEGQALGRPISGYRTLLTVYCTVREGTRDMRFCAFPNLA